MVLYKTGQFSPVGKHTSCSEKLQCTKFYVVATKAKCVLHCKVNT